MRWSGATDATARCKSRSTGCARKRRSVRVLPWICGVKPKPKVVNKPSHHFIMHGLDNPVYLLQSPILPCDPHGVLALFDKARLIKHQDALGITQLVRHELMIVPPHLFLIPADITDKTLPPTDGASLDL